MNPWRKKFDALHKMHHFYLILIISPLLMWLLAAIAGDQRLPGSAGQFAMIFGLFLGKAFLAILVGLLVLAFGKPSSAWIAIVVVLILSTYILSRSRPDPTQAALSSDAGQAPNNSFKPMPLRGTA